MTNLKSLALNHIHLTGSGLACVQKMSRLIRLELANTRLTDASLAHLKDLRNLQALWLTGSQVTGTGLVHLRNLHHLNELWLGGCPLGDASLGLLREFRWKVLNLQGTPVSDKGLEELKGCRGLELLRLRQTAVTPAGIADFQKSRPGCQVEWDR